MKLCKCGCGKTTEKITKTAKKRGYVKGEYRDYIWGHNTTKEVAVMFCLQCGAEIKRTIMPSGRKEDCKIYLSRKFCCPECSSIYRSGDKVWNWKGGTRTDSNGYIYLLIGKDHHLSDPYGYALEHRVIAEIFFGVCLSKDDVVHHKNGDRHDNRPENLEIMKRGKHSILHNKKNGREWSEYPK